MTRIAFKNRSMEFEGSGYFMDNAQTVSLGSIGTKATPFGSVGKLEVKSNVPVPKLEGKVRLLGPWEWATSVVARSGFLGAVSAGFKAIGFSGSAGAVFDAMAERRLKIVQLFIQEDDMISAVNSAPKARNSLHDYGGDGRVVHTVFVIMDAALAASVTAGTKLDLSAEAGGILSVKASGGAVVSAKSSFTVTPGTVLAYGMLNPDWSSREDRFVGSRVDETGVL